MSGIELQSQFNVQIAKPLDLRAVVADTTARDAIDSAVRYKGMVVYVIGESKFYYLKDGIEDTDWTEFSFGSGGGGVKNYFTDPYFSEKTDAAVPYNDYLSQDVVPASVDTTNNEIGPVAALLAFTAGDKVKYTTSGTAIGGLTAGDEYYVVEKPSGNLMKLGSSPGGTAITLTSQGSGTHNFERTYAGTTGRSYSGGSLVDTPVDHLAVSVNKTDPQSGEGSLEIDYTYDGDSAIGEGVRIGTNKIDVQDQGKALYCYTYLNFKDANYPSGDMKFKLWDKTNSDEIDLEALGIDTKIYNDARGYNFVFVPPTSTREYYFSLHSVADNATASWKGKCGTFTMTPQGSVPADIIETQTAELAGSSSLAANTTLTGSLTATGGTSTGIFSYNSSTGVYTMSKDAIVNLGASFSSSGSGNCQPAIYKGPSTALSIDGNAAQSAWSSANWSGELKKDDTFYFKESGGTASAAQRISVSAIATTRQILGTNELAMTPLKLFRHESAATAFTSSATIFKFSSGVIDNGSGWDSDNGQYKVPKAARLNIDVQIPFRTSTSTQGNAFCLLYVNGSQKLATYSTSKDAGIISLKYCDDFKEGDLIDIRVYNTTGTVSAVGTVVGCQATLSIDEQPPFSTFSVYGPPILPSDTTTNRPSSPSAGQMFFDTTLGQPIWYDGTGWVDATGASA